MKDLYSDSVVVHMVWHSEFGGNGITKVVSSVGGYSELLCALSTVRVAFRVLTGLTCCLEVIIIIRVVTRCELFMLACTTA